MHERLLDDDLMASSNDGGARVQRLVFGEVAETYERTRPDYPDEIIDELATICGLSPGDPVLEIGAGTGKATRKLLARGLTVTAVEPDAAMVEVARRHAGDAAYVVAGFEECTLPPRHFAAIVAAQSWHWVDDDIGPRRAADALRADGWIALMWHRPDLDDCAWHDDLQPIYQRITPGMEHGVRKAFSDSLPRAAEHLARSGRFGVPVQRVVPWIARYSTDEYVELLATHSDKRMLPDDQRAALFDAIRASLQEAGGVIDHPYVCELITAPQLDG